MLLQGEVLRVVIPNKTIKISEALKIMYNHRAFKNPD